MKILLDLPDQHVRALETIAARQGKPRAELLRRAVESYVSAHAQPITAFVGLWAGNPKTANTDEFLDELRKEWER
jgi:hypothetical protein